MFRLDEDLSGFYGLVGDDPELAWSVAGAGRMLRAPTVFEDVVKTDWTPIRIRAEVARSTACNSLMTVRRATHSGVWEAESSW